MACTAQGVKSVLGYGVSFTGFSTEEECARVPHWKVPERETLRDFKGLLLYPHSPYCHVHR